MKLPQFSLRDLFLLVVIAAMGCGWWVHVRSLPTRKDYEELKDYALDQRAQIKALAEYIESLEPGIVTVDRAPSFDPKERRFIVTVYD